MDEADHSVKGEGEGVANKSRAARKFEINFNNPQVKAACNEFCKKYLPMGVAGLCEEWQQNIKKYVPPGLTVTAFKDPANKEKNRYPKDVICNDATRVVLNDTSNVQGDYIHANHVKGEPLYNAFICTQGPLPASIADFWRMCVQEKVTHIVMLCEREEQGKTKCALYWPEKSGEILTAGAFKIKCVKIAPLIGFKDGEGWTRELEVSGPGVEKGRNLRHHHWKCWPDKNVPKSKLACLRLLKPIRVSTGTTVVHCSAGVGRTGTFVAIEMVIQEIFRKTNNKLNLVELCKKLRGMRMTAVQTDMQYVYIVVVIGNFIKSNNALDSENLPHYEKLASDFDRIVLEKGLGVTRD